MATRETVKRFLWRMPHLYAGLMVVRKSWEIRAGKWLEPELELVPELLRLGESAVDVGANYGLWSWHMARAVGESGRISAFEAIPTTASVLRWILWTLGVSRRVSVHAEACGADARATEFRLPTVAPDGPIVAGLAHVVGIEGPAGFPTMQVQVRRLDDLVDEQNVTLIKVDTEGAELFVLQGASRLLTAQQPTVVCEIGRGLLRERYGVEASQLIALMTEHGYDMYRLERGGRLVLADLSESHDGNYVFAANRHRDRIAARLAVDEPRTSDLGPPS